ncbi:hypothetical protein PS685_05347 [Pseudomonas fluorescens]|uniref:Uncharacterized protein n=1 Tax=Pseudomonas fluorescens TaxID=294 RepID=A0A5E7AF12_PSEFL|nr:hypothetical protein PS685_05347 [Pseudomonas fluorescens]
MGVGGRCLTVPRQQLGQLQFFIVAQPARLTRFIVQITVHRQAEYDAGQSFQQKQPLPACQSPVAIQPQNGAGQYRTKARGKRHGDHEQRIGPRPVRRRKPERHVQQHTGQKPRLGDTYQRTQPIQAGRVMGKQRGGRRHAPGNHQTANPSASAEFRQDHVAGDAARDVGQVENRGCHAELGTAQAQVVHHRQAGEADIDTVQK